MALVIVDQYPVSDASGVYINDVVWAQFSQELNATTATYYNFTVNERETYDPVDGEIEVQSISGTVNNAVIVFVPTNGLKRDTRYMVLASTGLESESGEALDHDTSWFFTTGNEAASGIIGDEIYDLDPSGFTVSSVVDESPTSGGIALAVVETYPADYATNVDRRLSYIKIRFNGIIPSGIDLYDHISINPRNVLG